MTEENSVNVPERVQKLQNPEWEKECPVCNEAIEHRQVVVRVQYPMIASKLLETGDYQFSSITEGDIEYSSFLIHLGCIAEGKDSRIKFVFDGIASEVIQDLGKSNQYGEPNLEWTSATPVEYRDSEFFGNSEDTENDFDYECPKCGGEFNEVKQRILGGFICPICNETIRGIEGDLE